VRPTNGQRAMNMRKEIHPIVSRVVAADGVSILEVIVVLAVVSIVVSFSAISIKKSRQSINLQNSARLFAGYAEKARIDAIRRHDPTNIDIKGPGTYSVTMNFDGTGVTTRTFTLDSGVAFTDSANVAYTVDGGGNVTRSKERR